MPIIAKSEPIARAAVHIPPATTLVHRPDIAPRPRTRRAPAPMEIEVSVPATEQSPKRRRGHAVKDENGKFQPTGDYPTGFARPPVGGQFTDKNPGGPGRPKGSKSHDTILKAQLSRKRKVRIDGKDRNLSIHEIMLANEVNLALKGDRQARRILLAEAQRLYREHGEAAAAHDPAGHRPMTETDAAILEFYRDIILHDREQMQGSPDADPPEPLNRSH